LERELVVRAQGGDHDAFSALASGSIDRLYSIARLILRSDDQAQDAVQDALLRAWLNIRGLRDPDAFGGWLRRLLINSCYNAARRERTRRITEIAPDGGDGPSAPDNQGSLAVRDQLDRAFRRLTPEQRAILVVRYYLDLSEREAADALGLPVGTVKSRLNRAASALRAVLEADDRAAVVGEGRPA
jgi:RNA polymerase sigma-70 factor (ECF subfamily)